VEEEEREEEWEDRLRVNFLNGVPGILRMVFVFPQLQTEREIPVSWSDRLAPNIS